MINLRRASKNDVKIIQELNNEVFVNNSKYDDDLVIDWAQSEKGEKYFTDLLNNPETYCLIAEENGKSVGYIAAVPKKISYRKSKYIEIDNMGVVPDSRSKGIGTLLVNKCLGWAKEMGFKKIYVNAYFQNIRAIDFYKRNGFAETDLSLERNI